MDVFPCTVCKVFYLHITLLIFTYFAQLCPCVSPCSPGCSWVPESVFGPVKGRRRGNEQEPDEWSCSSLVILCGGWERPGSNVVCNQDGAGWRGGHLPHLHLPRGGQHGVWGAAHYHLQRVRPYSCWILRVYPCSVSVSMAKRWRFWEKLIVRYNFFILLCSCGEVVTKREQFNDLSIDLPRRKKTLPLRSIQDSLDLFFRVSLFIEQILWTVNL